jgi:hypothetical protein
MRRDHEAPAASTTAENASDCLELTQVNAVGSVMTGPALAESVK